ncbi:hypothetical protein [Teichococcus aestuarii]
MASRPRSRPRPESACSTGPGGKGTPSSVPNSSTVPAVSATA